MNPSDHRRTSSISTILSDSDGEDYSSDVDESYARTDFGLESPTIVSHLIETVRKEATMTTNNGNGNDIPPPLGFDEFQTLSSTKQNIELFKILSAIAEEIEVLRQSTEQRFTLLESLIQTNKNYKLSGSCSSQAGDASATAAAIENGGGGSSGGTTTRPASWPPRGGGEPNRNQESRKDIELLIARNAAEDRPVLLNVGGKQYQVTWDLLDKLPQSRLGKLRKCHTEAEILELADGYDAEANEFFFKRHPRNFSCVLNFLSTGKLHLGEETCVIAFSQVCDFAIWKIQQSLLHQN